MIKSLVALLDDQAERAVTALEAMRQQRDAAIAHLNSVYPRTFVQGRLVVRSSCESEARLRMREQHPDKYDEKAPVIEALPNGVIVISQ